MAKSYISGDRDCFDCEFWFCGLFCFSVETGEAVIEAPKKGYLEAGLCLAWCETPTESDIVRYAIIYKNKYHTFDRQNREYLGEFSYCHDGDLLIDDWIVISKKEKVPGYRSVPKNTLFNLKSESEVPLSGLLQFIRYGRDFNSMLLKLNCYDSTAKSYWKLILLDLENGASIWERNLARLGSSVADITEEYVSVTDPDGGYIELLDVASGKLVRTLNFSGSIPFSVKGCVCLTNYSTKEMFHHIVESNVTYSKRLAELGCEGSYAKSGNMDVWLFINDETSKLSVYNLEADRCSHYYFPVIDLDENLNQVLDIRMIENKIRVVASVEPYKHACFNRVYVFEEHELCPFDDKEKFSHWNIEKEMFVGDYRKVVIEGNCIYQIQFEQTVTFSVLYRQLRSLLTIIGSEYGTTSHYIDKEVDTEWGGLIQVNLENQSLDDDEKKEIELLRILITHSISAEYTAGADPNVPISIEVSY